MKMYVSCVALVLSLVAVVSADPWYSVVNHGGSAEKPATSLVRFNRGNSR